MSLIFKRTVESDLDKARVNPKEAIGREMDLRGEEEEQHQNPFLGNNGSNTCYSSPSMPKLQFRNEISMARWDEKIGMGEVIEKKGGMWTCTGVIRNGGKLYCTIEEILFMVERGAMLLLDADDTVLNLKEIYKKVAEGEGGYSWESFEAYRHLKSLGYIVRRHGLPWTLKGEKNCCDPASLHSSSPPLMVDNSEKLNEGMEENVPIAQLFQNMQINEMKPDFDVYLPNSKFKKSSPGNPNFVFCLISDCPPSRAEVERLERQCNGVPLKFCNVDHGRVSFFSFDRIELPVLL